MQVHYCMPTYSVPVAHAVHEDAVEFTGFPPAHGEGVLDPQEEIILNVPVYLSTHTHSNTYHIVYNTHILYTHKHISIHTHTHTHTHTHRERHHKYQPHTHKQTNTVMTCGIYRLKAISEEPRVETECRS